MACKCDLVARREVSEKRGRELASSKDLLYFESSAVSGCIYRLTHSLTLCLSIIAQKSHQGVEEPFLYLTSKYSQLYRENEQALQEMTLH